MALRILTCSGLLCQELVRNRAPVVAAEHRGWTMEEVRSWDFLSGLPCSQHYPVTPRR